MQNDSGAIKKLILLMQRVITFWVAIEKRSILQDLFRILGATISFSPTVFYHMDLNLR